MLSALIRPRFRCSGGHGAAAVFALALALRLVYLGEIEDSPFFDAPVVDARTYADAARELAAGAWLGPDAPFWQPPLYPYLLGAVWSLLGVGWVAPRVLQALLGALTCVLLWRLGCRTLSPALGLAAALAAAFWGPLVLFGGELLPAVLAVPLDLAALLLLLRAAEASSPAVQIRRALLSGAAMGVAALCVANVLAFVPVAAAWLGRRASAAASRGWLAPGMVVLGAALAVAPVTVRNLVVGHDLVLISSNAGVNAFIGNNPDFERTLEIQPGPEWLELVSRPRREAGAVTASDQSRWFLGRAAEFAVTEPGDWMRLTVRKAHGLLHGAEAGRNLDLYQARVWSGLLSVLLWSHWLAFPMGLAMPLALLGVLLGWRAGWFRRPEARLLLWFLAVYGGTVIAFFPASRYRLPVVPVLLLLAALGAWQLAARIRLGWRQAAIPAGVLLALGVLCNVGAPAMDPEGGAGTQHRLGFVYQQKGMEANALRHYRRALQLDPSIREARYNLGALYARQGRFDRAAGEFETFVERFPDDPQGLLALGDALLQAGRPTAALESWEDLLRHPGLAEAQARGAVAAGPAGIHGRLAATRAQLGQLEESEAAYRSVLALAPDSLDARLQLGMVLEQGGRLAESEREYGRILQRDPGHLDARIRLAHLLFGEDRPQEAKSHLRRAIELRPGSIEARWMLAAQLIVEHRGQQALEQAEAILAIDPDHLGATWVAGHLHQVVGDRLVGEDHIERLKRLHVDRRHQGFAESLKQGLREMMEGLPAPAAGQ